MTLNDIIRKRTFEIRDSLKACYSEVKEFGKNEQARFNEKEAFVREIQDLRVEEQRGSVYEIDARIDKLQKEREKLVEDLNNAEDKVNSNKRSIEKIEKKLRTLEHNKKEMVSKKEDLEKTLRCALINSLKEYYDNLEQSIVSSYKSIEEKEAQILSWKKLNEAKDKDHKIMELWEGRQELKKFIGSASVPVVSNELKKQLSIVENKINDLFPGALSYDENETDGSETKEIFASENNDQIYLPISFKTWNGLNKGDSGNVYAEISLRLVWAIANEMDLNDKNPEFIEKKKLVLLKFDNIPDLFGKYSSFNIPLPDPKNFSLILAKLPKDLEEALRYED